MFEKKTRKEYSCPVLRGHIEYNLTFLVCRILDVGKRSNIEEDMATEQNARSPEIVP